jgi:hypothetical protein
MRRIFEIVVVTAAVAFAALGNVQKANAESRPGVVSPHAPPDIKSKTRHRVARAPRQTTAKSATAQTEVAPTGADPVFLSDAWLKQEKQTDDRLRRFMNICKGC